MSQIDLLLVGTITRDLIENRQDSPYRLGGTVSFAAATALRLGRRPTIVTRASLDTDFSELPVGADLHILPSETTTTFANVYTPQGRIQYCYTPTEMIRAVDIVSSYRRPRTVLLGPLVDDVAPDVAPIFDAATLVAAVPQGWMRRWDDAGRVFAKSWEQAATVLPYLDVLVLSLEDIDFDLSRLDLFFEHVPLVVLTEYRDGSTVYQRDENGLLTETKIPPRPAIEVDPTGAGDTFATAFVLRLEETGDPIHAARFANVTASFGVEAPGVAGIPSREQVLNYLREHGESQ